MIDIDEAKDRLEFYRLCKQRVCNVFDKKRVSRSRLVKFNITENGFWDDNKNEFDPAVLIFVERQLPNGEMMKDETIRVGLNKFFDDEIFESYFEEVNDET